MTPRFSTNFRYTDRKSKADYVWKKYEPLLRRSVLDVGSDECPLKPYVEGVEGRYWGIGFGPNVDQEVDLETGQLPFEPGSFETVLCLDVLEHLEAAHRVFADLCRIAERYVIVSLPNPWAVLWSTLRTKDYSESSRMKFYGLPLEPPQDRHRWFFSQKEAEVFLQHNAEMAGFRIVQMDNDHEGALWQKNLRGLVYGWVLRKYFRSDIDELGLANGTIWCVLERKRQS
jgi:hypothetical protein